MIDIVTINLNNKVGLEKTVNSVLNQSFFHKINYIIIDGGSTDGSKDVIKKISDKLHYWCSEQDKGIFNAMNKGIDHLTGDYVLFLNSGDYLHSSTTIENVYDQLDSDIVYGNQITFHNIDAIVSYVSRDAVTKYPDKLDEGFFRRSALPHQSTFIRTSLQKQHKYDESCKIAGDWKMTREAILCNGASYKHIPVVISHYNLDGISSRQQKLFQKEKMEYYAKLQK